jgi:eukaryotic-like serine/threonine-protein kinase
MPPSEPGHPSDQTAPSPWESRGDPEHIGPYRLLDVLGEGGMGVVYLAEQAEPIRRRVALKIIKLGMDTRDVVARFDSERHALAVMDHPNIARVLDGGATETGRPYFVMELVRGTPITDYADTHKLTTEERIRLFMDVCEAVQHAHQKGVIHRDLKPSNVLVMVQDSKPVVKVIDFGIAKAIGQQLTDRTLVTKVGQMIGTPDYMSPEQAEMSGLDVDTRTDIYSLGVMLYELMVGTLPFDLATRPDHTIPHALREREAARPSTKLTRMGDMRGPVAKLRRTTPDTLRRELKGDLDWVILKAMDKDRTRRYEAANGLALDLERHLANEPVRARPPSAGYRVAKFVRRHRAGVVGAAVALLAVVLGGAAATLGFVRATHAEARAEQDAATARQVSDFLVGLFQVNDPTQARGRTITAQELLDSGAVRIDAQLKGQPLVQARLMRTMGAAYTGLGHYDQANSLLQQSVALQDAAPEANPAELARTLQALGDLDRERGQFKDAEQAIERSVAIDRRLFGQDDVRVANGMALLGGVYVRDGRYKEAESVLKAALATQQRALGAESATVANTLNSLGAAYWHDRQLAEAQPYLERALAIRRKVLPANDPTIGEGWNNLGVLYYVQGQYGKAEQAYERARAIFEATLAPDHPLVAQVLNNLAETYAKQKQYQKAEQAFQRALAIKEKNQAAADPTIAVSLNGLANVYRDERRFADAEPLYRRALDIREKALGPTDPELVETLRDYAKLLDATGRTAEARKLEDQAAAIQTQRAGH